MHIKVLSPSCEEEWDKYLLKNKYADFLQSFCWAQLLKAVYGFKSVFLKVQDEGSPVAYFLFHEEFPYIRSKKMGYRLLNLFGKSFTKYIDAIGGPVILDYGKTEEIISEVLEWLDEYSKKNHIQRISLTPFRYNENYANNPAIESIFEGFGYSTKKWATYLIDLEQDEESLWMCIEHSARKALKQVMRTNLAVKRTENYKEYIEKFVKPYNKMETEMGRTEFPVWLVEKTRNINLKDKYYHYFYAEIDGKILGVLGMYVYNGYATEIMSSTSKYAYENKIYAQDLLHWEMFKFAKKLGCHTFDMAGVNPNPVDPKEKGIHRFKKKWGGRYVEFNQFEKQVPGMSSFLGRLVHRGYRVTQAIKCLRGRWAMGRGIRYPHVASVLKEYYTDGRVLEIAAGGAVYKDIFPDYVGTDLPTNPYSEKGDLNVYCDAQHLPFKEDTFESAFVIAALYQIQNTELVLSEISRILKPSGHFLVFDYNKKTTKRLKATENGGDNFNHVWSPWELRRIIQKAGFNAQIIKSWNKVESSKGIKTLIVRKVPSSVLYSVTNLFCEGWNIIVATNKKIG
jgi:lipid II:glycine glycyltransferase (peptidoglycan interpeptide bridge formation enzyme)